jgi:hypothetical protein
MLLNPKALPSWTGESGLLPAGSSNLSDARAGTFVVFVVSLLTGTDRSLANVPDG